jgi:hypothetical protein
MLQREIEAGHSRKMKDFLVRAIQIEENEMQWISSLELKLNWVD